MAEIAVPGHRSTYSQSFGPMTPPSPSMAADYEMVPNPHFVFPRLSQSVPEQPSALPHPVTRTTSLNVANPPPRAAGHTHRRTASNLPAFTFNSSDTSGLKDEQDPPSPARQSSVTNELVATTPSRHVRNNSELVGGDPRFGMSAAVRVGSDKAVNMTIPPGRGSHRRGHSVALSQHDRDSLVSQPDPARLSSSLPNTPLERPDDFAALDHPATSESSDHAESDMVKVSTNERPPSSRREVAFSDNVEIIPRPLSTISSETESSMSTVRGHSVNNSISSVLSMGMPNPASARVRSPSLEATPEDGMISAPRSSLEFNKRSAREGQWLQNDPAQDTADEALIQPSLPSPKLSVLSREEPPGARPVHKRKQSLGQALGFDRRKSEPVLSIQGELTTRMSALSLQEAALTACSTGEESSLDSIDNRSSTRRIKDWALSKISWRSREQHARSRSELPSLLMRRPDFADPIPVACTVPSAPLPVAETDLDAVFSSQRPLVEVKTDTARPQSMYELSTPTTSQHSITHVQELEEYGTMLDLDAALGPFKTPPLGSQRHRREMHSSRSTRDFNGPRSHYMPPPSHRRAESAPMLTPFDFNRVSTPPQSTMADVFEEDEEEDEAPPSRGRGLDNATLARDDESGIGIQIVDADASANDSMAAFTLDDGLQLHSDVWEMERPTTSYGNQSSRLSTPIMERRPSSVLDETIEEEPSQLDFLDIVEAHEEPRAASLAKSSDSSETPTLLAPQPDVLLSDDHRPFMTPDTLHTSAYSSPDFSRRQCSFDTSRVGTSASSMTDNRTLSSSNGCDPVPDVRCSVDDIPSLTSSRSTMMTHGNTSRRDISGVRTPSVQSSTQRPSTADIRRKRSSIPGLSRLVSGSFGSDSHDQARPQTASDALLNVPRKKEHRLKKLMFWKSKHRPVTASS